MKKVVKVVGPCSKNIQGEGWVTEIPESTLNDLGYYKEEEIYEMAEATVKSNIADGGTSCHWCMDTTKKQTAKEIYEELVKVLAKQYEAIEFHPAEEIKNIFISKGVKL